jgi:5-formyltetrahydrofolate cyclo-ligase
MNLRQQLRHQRKQLSPQDVMVVSQAVTQQIITLPAFSSAQHIAFYFPSENEIDPAGMVSIAQQQNKKIYFPIMQNKALIFCRIDEKTQYQKNQVQILEPVYSEKNIISVDQIDLFFVPLVAFDAQCHRMGRGAGFYDRVLKDKKGMAIGLAYAFQEVDVIAAQPWDVAMDMIVTETAVFMRSPSQASY